MSMTKELDRFIAEKRSSVDAQFRGTYHLGPEVGWMNDPNGFVFFRGRYHIFWQYNPYYPESHPICWGHAVSDDLVVWEYLPVAIAPDRDYDADGCWSGSAIVVDDRLWLIYTGNTESNGKRRQTQNLACSDDGIHFCKYGHNPVISENELPSGASIEDFRDPFVWEHEGKYYLLIGTVDPGCSKVLTYRSDDLMKWSYLGVLDRRANAGRCWECPCTAEADGRDIFICSPENHPPEGLDFWNFSSNICTVGTIDYSSGRMETGKYRETDKGLDFYAAQLTRGKDGVLLMSAWMNMWARSYVPAMLGHGWTGSLILPREVTLRGDRLIQSPVKAIEKYYADTVEVQDVLTGSRSYSGICGTALHLAVTAELCAASVFSVSVFSDGTYGIDLVYARASGTLTLDRSRSEYPISADERELSRGMLRKAQYVPEGDVLRLNIFLDRSSIEVFVGDGELTMTALSFNRAGADGIVFSCEGSAEVRVRKDDIVIPEKA